MLNSANTFSIRSIPAQWKTPAETGSTIRTVLADVPTDFGVMNIYFPVLMPGLSQTGLHAHEGHEMILPISGALDLEFDDGYCAVDAQHPIYLPPGKMHRVAGVHSPGPCLLFLLRWASNEPCVGLADAHTTLFDFDRFSTMDIGSASLGSLTLSAKSSDGGHSYLPSNTFEQASKILLLINGSFDLPKKQVPALGAAVCPAEFPIEVVANQHGSARWFELSSIASHLLLRVNQMDIPLREC